MKRTISQKKQRRPPTRLISAKINECMWKKILNVRCFCIAKIVRASIRYFLTLSYKEQEELLNKYGDK